VRDGLALLAKTGLPREAFGQLFEHAVLDLRHGEELHELLDSLPLHRHDEELVGVSAFQTVELLGSALRDVFAFADRDAASLA
jgi:hypothetical protein